MNYFKDTFFSNLHYFKIVNQKQHYLRDYSPLQSLELPRTAASITNDKGQRGLTRWGDHVDGASLTTAPAQSARLWDFFSAMKGGAMPGAPSNLIFTCQIWTIFYFTESEAISQNTCFRERLPDLSGIGQFHRTFQSGNRFVLLMEKLMKTSSPKKELAVSWHVRPSSAESLFFALTGRQRKIILLLRKENAFYHPIICEYKLLFRAKT